MGSKRVPWRPCERIDDETTTVHFSQFKTQSRPTTTHNNYTPGWIKLKTRVLKSICETSRSDYIVTTRPMRATRAALHRRNFHKIIGSTRIEFFNTIWGKFAPDKFNHSQMLTKVKNQTYFDILLNKIKCIKKCLQKQNKKKNE